jgi:hypothetical protein
MAAREDQPQPIVDDRAHRARTVQRGVRIDRRKLFLDRGFTAQQLLFLGQRPATAEAVNRPVASGRRDPRAGVVRDPPSRPRLERRDERLLDGFLGEVEVAEDADQRRDGATLLLAEQALDRCPGARLR